MNLMDVMHYVEHLRPQGPCRGKLGPFVRGGFVSNPDYTFLGYVDPINITLHDKTKYIAALTTAEAVI